MTHDQIPENLIVYIFLTPIAWDGMRRRAGDDLIEGENERGPYLQELHIRYIKIPRVPFGNEVPLHVR